MDNYLLVKGTAGLGNRIFALVTAILYARMSGRILAVDWRDNYYSSDGENIFFDLFELQNLSLTQTIPNSDSIYPKLWQGCLEQSMTQMISKDQGLIDVMGQAVLRKYAYDVRNLNYPDEIVIGSGYTEEIERIRSVFSDEYSAFKHVSKAIIFRETFHKHLRLTSKVQERIDSFREQHFKGRPTIGIHIRRSDKAISYPWYKRALAEHVRRYPDARIFLATDNRDVEAEISSLYPNVSMVPKWLPTPGLRAHGNVHCPDLKEHAIEALLDLFLLASCDYLIYSRTTSFGLLASYISQALVENHFDIQFYNDQRKKGLKKRTEIFKRKIERAYKYGLGLFKLGGS
ncbi:MAG: nodulation protein NodZ [Cyanobacteria bacterium P01_F01_bin.116]